MIQQVCLRAAQPSQLSIVSVVNPNNAQGLKEKVIGVLIYIRDTFFFGIHQVKIGISRAWLVLKSGTCRTALVCIGASAWIAELIRPGTEQSINLWGARFTALIIEYQAEAAREKLTAELRNLEGQNQQLNQELNRQLGNVQLAKNGQKLLSLQNDHLNSALQVAQNDALQAIDGRSALERERNELAHTKKVLSDELEKIKKEKEILVKEIESWKAKHAAILPVAEKNERELTEAYRALRASLVQAHNAYQQQISSPTLNIELATAINRYKDTYEGMLGKRIAALSANDPALIPLRGLLECSQRDREISANITEEYALQAKLSNLIGQVPLGNGE